MEARDQRRFRAWIEDRVAGRRPEFDAVERLLAVAAAPGGEVREADFPGCRVEWRGRLLAVRPPLARPRR